MDVTTEDRFKKNWTPDEDYTLEEHLHVIGPNNYKRLLPGRSLGSVRNHISYMGLGKQRLRRNGLSYTPQEVAEILGVPRYQVMKWIKKGLIRSVESIPSLWVKKRKVRRSYSIPWSAVDDFLTEYPMLFKLESFPPLPLFAQVHHRITLERAHPEFWINTSEAARILESREQWPRRLARDGQLPATRVGGNWYYLRSDVIRYSNGRRLDRAAATAA